MEDKEPEIVLYQCASPRLPCSQARGTSGCVAKHQCRHKRNKNSKHLSNRFESEEFYNGIQ